MWFSNVVQRLITPMPDAIFLAIFSMRLSDRNSILMTQNLSGIRSEALIGRPSSFIVLAIVYE